VSKIEVGRYSELLRRFLQQKGQEEIAGELSPEISPIFVLESDRTDWAFLKNERLGIVSINQTSGATPGPLFRVRNPLGSGVIATLSDIWVTLTVGPANLRVNFVQVNAQLPGGNLNGRPRDFRWGPNFETVLLGSFDTTTVGIGTRLFEGRLQADTNLHLQIPVVIPPGFGVEMGTNAVQAQGLIANYMWVERQLTALEAE